MSVDVGVRLEINQEIIRKLSSKKAGLWTAAHDDGSANRINENAVIEAAGYSTTLGILSAVFQGLRKKFRNRGKTKEDLEAEKEAAEINRASGALEQMLLDYLRAAQEGSVDEESLDELIKTLEEIMDCKQSGKLIVPGKKELAEICESIVKYTEAMTGSKPLQPIQADEFSLIRDQLIAQRKWIGKKTEH